MPHSNQFAVGRARGGGPAAGTMPRLVSMRRHAVMIILLARRQNSSGVKEYA